MTDTLPNPDTFGTESEPSPVALGERKFDIFVSYRVQPDEKLAVAVRRLIEASFTPAPNVFASGVGGILPSNQGFRVQIEAAARQARAFIGIITKSSLDREWIFFEAGAAWGRNAMYIPLLIDVGFADLPSTIGAYQAIQADDLKKVKQLFEELGRVMGVAFRPQFDRRFRTFEGLVKAYPGDPSSSDEPSIEALKILMSAARYDDAEQMAKALRDGSSEPEVKNRAEIVMVVADERLKIPEKLNRLHRLSASGTDASPYLHWNIAVLERRAHVRLEHYERCLERNPPDLLRQAATCELAALLAKRGNESEAAASLSQLILSANSTERTNGAWALFELIDKQSPVVRCTLALISIAGAPDEEHFRGAFALTHSERWHALTLFLAQLYYKSHKDAGSALYLGLALENADMPNLAYQAYQESAEKGISVAKPNMASLMMRQGLVSPGLAIMTAHEGEFDAAHPDHPYGVRKDLERAMRIERELQKSTLSLGERQFDLWVEIAECCMRNASSPAFPETLQIDGITYQSTNLAPTSVTLAPRGESPGEGSAGKSIELKTHRYVPGLWYGKTSETFLIALCEDSLRGLRIVSGAESGTIAYVDVQVPPPQELLAASSGSERGEGATVSQES